MLTQKYLKECLVYDPDTGIFVWKQRPKSHFTEDWIWADCNNKHAGTVAGSKTNDGYIRIKIDQIEHRAHILAWLYTYGYIPENEIDHWDRIKHHNYIHNLREVSHICNMRNKDKLSNNTSGVTGVNLNSNKDKWVVRIKNLKKRQTIGTFIYFTEAVAHRLAAEQCLNWSGCNSTSTAYLYMQNYLKRRTNEI